MPLNVTAYFDESGTHGSAYTVVGGYLGTEHQWVILYHDWKQLLSAYGINSFHSKEDFRKWDEQRRRRFSREAKLLLKKGTLFSIVAAVPVQLHNEYRKDPGIKTYKHSHYGLCFHFAAMNAIRILRKKDPQVQVSFVLEQGHKNAGDVTRIFDAAKLGRISGEPLMYAANLGTLVFESGLFGFEPADLLVYEAYHDLLQNKFATTTGKPRHDVRLILNQRLFENLKPRMVELREHMKRYSASKRDQKHP